MKQDKCRERLLKYQAYRAVLDEHSFTSSKLSMEEKLEKNYSHFALQPYIDEKLEVLHPSYVARKKSLANYEKSKEGMYNLMKKNMEKLQETCTRGITEEEREKVQVYFRDPPDPDEEEQEVVEKKPVNEKKSKKTTEEKKESVKNKETVKNKEVPKEPENDDLNQGEKLLESEESEDEQEQLAPLKEPNPGPKRELPVPLRKEPSSFAFPVTSGPNRSHIERKLSFKASLELEDRRKGISAAPGIPVIRENSLLSVNLADEYPSRGAHRGPSHKEETPDMLGAST